MYKKIILFAALFFMLAGRAFADEIIMDTSSGCKLSGQWTRSGQTGYGEQNVLRADGAENAEVLWNLSKPGVFRLYYWKTVDPENGASDTKLTVSSERTNREFNADFSQGNAGWNEIGIAESGGAGTKIIFAGGNGIIYASAIKAETLGAEYSDLFSYNNRYKKNVLLLADSKNAYVDGVRYKIDDAVPTIVGGTTFVPIRFVSEALGADVKWDTTKNIAAVSYNGKQMTFAPNSTQCTIDGEVHNLAQSTFISNDRMMLPLRFISENMDKMVFWSDTGVISITEGGMPDAQKDSKMINNIYRILKTE